MSDIVDLSWQRKLKKKSKQNVLQRRWRSDPYQIDKCQIFVLQPYFILIISFFVPSMVQLRCKSAAV